MRKTLNFSWILVLIVLSVQFSKAQDHNLLTGQINHGTSHQSEQLINDPQAYREHQRRMLANPTTGKIPENIRQQELNFMNSSQVNLKQTLIDRSQRAGQNSWRRRGPNNVGGSTRAIAIDRTYENVIIAGAVSGGMWRSNDGGASWIKTTTPSQFYNATCVIQDPRPGFSNIWYFGTGESVRNTAGGGAAPYRGNGIYKSVDGGNTWSLLSATSSNPTIFGGGTTYGGVGQPASGGEFAYVSNLAMNRRTGDLYAATYTGIMRSTDGGASWVKVLAASNGTPTQIQLTDVAVSGTGVVYATISSGGAPNAGFYYSNNGINWTNATQDALGAFGNNKPTAYGKVAIGIAPSAPNIVYFFASMAGGTGNVTGFGLLRFNITTNQWENLSNKLPNYGGAVGALSGANDTQHIHVKLDDPNYVFIGSSNLFRSTDGFVKFLNDANDNDPGRTNWIGGFSNASNGLRYANHHPGSQNMAFYPSNPNKVISSHNGGISVCDNITATPVVWRSLNNGYFTSQVNALAIDEDTPGDTRIMAGFADNNSKWTSYGSSAADNWYQEDGGGSGSFVAIYPGTAIHRRYTSTEGGIILRFDGPQPSDFTKADAIHPSNAGSQIPIHPWILDPVDPNRMFYPGSPSRSNNPGTPNPPVGIWRNNNLDGINSGYGFEGTTTNWVFIAGSEMDNSDRRITALAASKTGTYLYYGTDNGQLWRLDNRNANSVTKINIFSGKGLPTNAYVSSLAIDPLDESKVVVTFSNYGVVSVYYTQDAGVTWNPVAGNLEQNADGSGNGPSVRWASIIKYAGGETGYFVGTSTGLYYTESLNGNNTQWVQQATNLIGNAVVPMVKVRDSDGLVVVATHGDGVFSAFYGAADLPPVASKDLPDVRAYKNDNPYKFNLREFFTDPDGNVNDITFEESANSNPSLVSTSISANGELTLFFNADQTGTALITLQATSNGKTVEESFRVFVRDIPNNEIFNQSTSLSPRLLLIGEYNNGSAFGADDFEIPAGQTWTLERIEAYLANVSLPVNPLDVLVSVDVYIYSDSAGYPARETGIIARQNIFPSRVCNLPVARLSLVVSEITLNQSVTLSTGKYWLRISPVTDDPAALYAWAWLNDLGPGNAVTSTNNGPYVRRESGFVFNLIGRSVGSPRVNTPSELKASIVSTSQTKLIWKDNSINEGGFQIERSTSSSTGFAQVGIVGRNVTTWTDNTGLELGTTYYYRVRAFEPAGSSNEYSNEASITLQQEPQAPTTLSLTEFTTIKKTFQWADNANNESGYELLSARVSGKGYARILTTEANQNNVGIDTDTTENHDFFYVVRALAPQGNSEISNEVAVLAFPKGLSAQINPEGNALTLSWQDASLNETAYKIERSIKKEEGFEEVGSVEANVTTFEDNIQAGETYYYRVRAVSEGAFSLYSNVLEAGSLTTSLEGINSSIVEVYPNPSQEYFVVKINNARSKSVKVQLRSLNGQLIDSQFMAADPQGNLRAVFGASYLPKGVYVLELRQGDTIKTHRVVIH